MYCILVTGIPAAGKTTMAKYLSEQLSIPVISKDRIKELLFDDVGFKSREEKVKLGIASMSIMYYMAEQFMKNNLPFILENNFESISKEKLDEILTEYSYKAITVTLTGEYKKIYERFVARDISADRHRGHVVNDCYPEIESGRKYELIPYESFVAGIRNRGMDSFSGNGPHIVIDTTDFQNVDMKTVLQEIIELRDGLL